MELIYTIYKAGKQFDEEDEFIYEPDNNDLLKEVAFLIYDDYFDDKKKQNINFIETITFIEKFIYDFDLLDIIAENYEDELKDSFEREAIEYYNEKQY